MCRFDSSNTRSVMIKSNDVVASALTKVVVKPAVYCLKSFSHMSRDVFTRSSSC